MFEMSSSSSTGVRKSAVVAENKLEQARNIIRQMELKEVVINQPENQQVLQGKEFERILKDPYV
ncbi:hypothetical protein [Thermoanaerobacterium sp. DL9XJH110]|uniref:hypothetical protein n=1 Tax=Thermoanaerobacterium sp. DL9XJH110 TaxID=3386643 RepID=UPI003BB61B12